MLAVTLSLAPEQISKLVSSVEVLVPTKPFFPRERHNYKVTGAVKMQGTNIDQMTMRAMSHATPQRWEGKVI